MSSSSVWTDNWSTAKRLGQNKYSAGILPYTFDPSGKCIFLLGKDNEGDWSDFGGRCEFKDRNDEKRTAAREFFEETLGSVITIPECIEKLKDSFKIISTTLNGSPYYMFVMKIEHLNYMEYFNRTTSFLEYYCANNYTEKHSINRIIEKKSIRWVTIDTLVNCLENKNKMSPIPLRGVFYKTLESSIGHLIKLGN
jgi:hypothetical protein